MRDSQRSRVYKMQWDFWKFCETKYPEIIAPMSLENCQLLVDQCHARYGFQNGSAPKVLFVSNRRGAICTDDGFIKLSERLRFPEVVIHEASHNINDMLYYYQHDYYATHGRTFVKITFELLHWKYKIPKLILKQFANKFRVKYTTSNGHFPPYELISQNNRKIINKKFINS